MMHRRIFSGIMMAGLVSVLLSSPGHAAPQNKRLARRHFTEGKRHFLAGEYTRAVRAFERAYRHRPHRVILFNIALTHARLGNALAAATHLRRYLKQAQPTDPPLPAELRQVGRRVGVLSVRVKNPRARIYIDGRFVGAQQPSPGRRRFGRLHWAYFAATAGATVGLFIGAIATSARAKSIHDDYAKEPTNTALGDLGQRTQRIANALWGITAVSALSVAVVAFFTRWKQSERAHRFTARPTVGPGQAGLSLHWKY